MLFMDKILASYHETGIQTVGQADADHVRHVEAYQQKNTPAKPGKTVIEQRYEQREYDPEKYLGLTPEELEEVRRYDT